MMRTHVQKSCQALVCIAGLLAAPAVFAEDPAPAAQPSDVAPQQTSPAPQPTSPAPQEAGAAPAQNGPTPQEAGAAPGAATPQAKEEAPAETVIPAFFRFDADSTGLALWAGATHPVGPIGLVTDIYVTSTGFSEFDIGPMLTFGPFSILPMAGLGFDFINHQTLTLIAPQLYGYLTLDQIYVESWHQLVLNSVFTEGTQNSYYTRDFALYNPIRDLGFGPHFEATVDLNEVTGVAPDPETPAPVDDTGLASLQIGGIVGLNYGKASKLLLYLGYETQEESQVNGKLAGRFTFVYNF